MREVRCNDRYNTAQVPLTDVLQSDPSIHLKFDFRCLEYSNGIPQSQQSEDADLFVCSALECLQSHCAHSLQLEFGDSPLGLKGFVHERIYLEHVRHPSVARDLPEKKIRAQSLKTM